VGLAALARVEHRPRRLDDPLGMAQMAGVLEGHADRERVALGLSAGDLRRQALDALEPSVPPTAADRAVVTDALRAAFDEMFGRGPVRVL